MDAKDVLELEEKYKKLLTDKLKTDKRLAVSCPEFKYPEPVYVYVKCVKTEKSIAVRLDGEDGTMRFWDYADDDYADEEGVWSNMTEKGLENIVKKLYIVMDKAVDIEFYDRNGDIEDYYSGIVNYEINAENALKKKKKHGKDIKFAFVKYSDFFGTKCYVFDKEFNRVKK